MAKPKRTKEYRVLVCGGQSFNDSSAVFSVLDGALLRAKSKKETLVVIQGGATGADSLARVWCARHPEVKAITCPADMKAHGKAAGSIRNQAMLHMWNPHTVVAFPGGPGTADMIRRAKEERVYTILWPNPTAWENA